MNAYPVGGDAGIEAAIDASIADIDGAHEELHDLGCLLMEARQRIAYRRAAKSERAAEVIESERRRMLAAVAPIVDALARTACVPVAGAIRRKQHARPTVSASGDAGS